MLTRVSLALVFLAVVAARAQSPARLSLEAALATVDRVNVNVLLSREALAQAMESALQQKADLIPSVSASVQQRRSVSPGVSATSKTAGSPANSSAARLSGSYQLLSPQQILQYRAARVGVAVAELDVQQTVQSVLASVAQTFFTHLRNVKRIDVLDANIGRARELVRLARNQVDAGVATQIDITRAESQLSLAEQARLQQATVVYQSELLLKRLLDLEARGTLTLEDFVVRRVEESEFAVTDEKSLFERRADYLRTQKALEQVHEQYKAAKSEQYGSLSLSGDYGFLNTELFDGDDQVGWSAGLGYSVPVFDGGRIKTNQRQLMSQIRSQEYRLRQVELLISSEMRLAHQDARSRFAQVGVAEKSLQLSEEELQLAQRRFEQGVADNREIIDAQNRLAQASDNLNEAIYLYNLSRVELARARGDVRGVVGERQ
ncbi:MAG: TolC family protein [Opitutaceae bacterium]|nr:TolC family protein [Opitutaceae bacterium]